MWTRKENNFVCRSLRAKTLLSKKLPSCILALPTSFSPCCFPLPHPSPSFTSLRFSLPYLSFARCTWIQRQLGGSLLENISSSPQLTKLIPSPTRYSSLWQDNTGMRLSSCYSGCVITCQRRPLIDNRILQRVKACPLHSSIDHGNFAKTSKKLICLRDTFPQNDGCWSHHIRRVSITKLTSIVRTPTHHTSLSEYHTCVSPSCSYGREIPSSSWIRNVKKRSNSWSRNIFASRKQHMLCVSAHARIAPCASFLHPRIHCCDGMPYPCFNRLYTTCLSNIRQIRLSLGRIPHSSSILIKSSLEFKKSNFMFTGFPLRLEVKRITVNRCDSK